MSPAVLNRETFARSRALEFFTESELVMQIGCGRDRWSVALLKELLDNALDGCERARVTPDITVTVTRDAIAVRDNGPGMPETTIARMLDPTVRVSSNLGYVAPTRGQLGNAWKCLLGAASVCGGSIAIATGGQVHTLTVEVDQIEQLPVVQHAITRGHVRAGTEITLRWPEIASSLAATEPADFYNDIRALCRQYAALNPHAAFRLRAGRRRGSFDAPEPTWRKWRPSDPTSAHWYTEPDFATLIAAYVARDRESGRQRTVRELVAEFAGLSGSAKQKAVTDAVGLTGARLIDLVRDETQLDAERVAGLLAAMQRSSRRVPPAALGVFGRERCIAVLATQWQVVAGSVRYKRVAGEVDGVPFVVEAAFGIRPEGPRALAVGCNFSPLLDPEEATDAIAYALHQARVDPHDPVVVFAHLITPQPPFTDHGKRALAFGYDDPRAEALDHAVRRVIPKTWKQAKRRADREDRLQARDLERLARAEQPKVNLKQAAYAEMEAAYRQTADDGAGGTLPANARQIMYAARGPVMARTDGKCWSKSSYFTQTLLPNFVDAYADLTATWDVVYDARGHVSEPHTGLRTDLGTLEVRDYVANWHAEREDRGIVVQSSYPTRGPQHRFRYALFVEKEGFNPLLERVRLAERFDVAIMSTKGMSVTAARTLVEALSNEGVTVFVLHDFDKAGFSILHTLRSDTRRHTFRTKPKVIDLGVRLADVESLGLQSEPVTYKRAKKDPRINLRRCGATEAECDFLVRGDGPPWAGDRVELNAMRSRQLVDWLEAKLVAHGVKKFVPMRDVLAAAYQRARRLATIQRAIDVVNAAEARKVVQVPANLAARVRAMLAENPAQPWDNVVWRLARGEVNG